jgi:DNA-binding NarL/FixJ family response regulator
MKYALGMNGRFPFLLRPSRRIMRILIADDQANIRSALTLLLEQEAQFEIVAEAAEAAGLLQAVRKNNPDLLLLDWELPGLEGEHLLHLLRYGQPHLLIVALSSRPEAEAQAIKAGADAFISKGALPEQVLTAVYNLLPTD